FAFDKPRHETIAWNIIKTPKNRALSVLAILLKSKKGAFPSAHNNPIFNNWLAKLLGCYA
ncbi:MAG TPA: hypothetical protein PKY17_07690, partial [Agitococcus sp.]|nr:hypothetical protein [Agitococcus sp.]